MLRNLILSFSICSCVSWSHAYADIYECDGTWQTKPCEGQVSKHVKLSPLEEGLLSDLKKVRTSFDQVGVELNIGPLIKSCGDINASEKSCKKDIRLYVNKNKSIFNKGRKRVRFMALSSLTKLASDYGVVLDLTKPSKECLEGENSVESCEKAISAFILDNREKFLEAMHNMKLAQQLEENLKIQTARLELEEARLAQEQENAAQLRSLAYDQARQNMLLQDQNWLLRNQNSSLLRIEAILK